MGINNVKGEGFVNRLNTVQAESKQRKRSGRLRIVSAKMLTDQVHLARVN